MIKLNATNFDEIIKKSDKLVVVDFWAEWCGPCRMVDPIIEDLSKDYTGKITFVKCDVDEEPTITSKFSIRNIPTVLFLKNGNVIDKQVGAVQKSHFVNKINTLLQ